jgi:hypothetical protein
MTMTLNMLSSRVIVWANTIVSTTLYLALSVMQHTETAKTPLPPDLYSLILEHIVDPSDLAKLCQVDRGRSAPCLYRQVYRSTLKQTALE